MNGVDLNLDAALKDIDLPGDEVYLGSQRPPGQAAPILICFNLPGGAVSKMVYEPQKTLREVVERVCSGRGLKMEEYVARRPESAEDLDVTKTMAELGPMSACLS